MTTERDFNIQVPATISLTVTASSLEEAVAKANALLDDDNHTNDVSVCDSTTLPWNIDGDDVDVSDML